MGIDGRPIATPTPARTPHPPGFYHDITAGDASTPAEI